MLRYAVGVVAAAGLFASAACGGGTHEDARPAVTTSTSPTVPVKVETGLNDEARAAMIRLAVPAVREVDTPRLVNLADVFCRDLSSGDDPKRVFRLALAQGFSEADAFALISTAVTSTCPSNASRVTYESLGWRP